MNMPLGAARPPDTATVDGAPAGTTDRTAHDGGSGDAGDADSGTDGRVDGTAREPSGPDLGQEDVPSPDGPAPGDPAPDGRSPDGRSQDGRSRDGRSPRGRERDTGPRDVVGSAEWDLVTDRVHWTAEAYLLLGCDPGDGPLSLDRLPDRLPEADRPLLRRMMTDALIHGRTSAGTLRIHRGGGRPADVECAGEPVLGADGTVTALRMLLRPAR
ncbi:hypothetical protein ACFYUY_35995 [Kitasatospora sp. NPDC004745]|uniref:hypothetical protein n=1 Tax=unclassified Kitasatospora TaxID=2633591 RepID=UPI0033F3178B